MSSVTDDEPGSEDSGLDESRPGRGKGRRGRLWRRHDKETPDVGELEEDDLQELLRRSHTSGMVEGEDAPEPTAPATHEPPADMLADTDPDNIAARVGNRTGPAATAPEDADDVDWRALVSPTDDAPADEAATDGAADDGDDMPAEGVPADDAGLTEDGNAADDPAAGDAVDDVVLDETSAEPVAGESVDESSVGEVDAALDVPGEDGDAADEPAEDPVTAPLDEGAEGTATPDEAEGESAADWAALIDRAVSREEPAPVEGGLAARMARVRQDPSLAEYNGEAPPAWPAPQPLADSDGGTIVGDDWSAIISRATRPAAADPLTDPLLDPLEDESVDRSADDSPVESLGESVAEVEEPPAPDPLTDPLPDPLTDPYDHLFVADETPGVEEVPAAEELGTGAEEPVAEEPAAPAPAARATPGDHHTTDEEAGQRVIAAAVDGGFAEPTPVPAPKGLARLRRRNSPGSAPRPEARPLQEFIEPPLLEERIPDVDGPPEIPRRPAEVLAQARAEIEAELAPAVDPDEATTEGVTEAPANADVVAALAARMRRDAELAAAEQAAERYAAEEAAQRAHEARAEADRLAQEQAQTAETAHRARAAAEELARAEAAAREAAERAARERAELADAE
ncbi:MAG TPA: hypothetical protein VM575_11215, partial [Nocardioides sp.]|nr:hypothetical protein [Nocardioides sp.]